MVSVLLKVTGENRYFANKVKGTDFCQKSDCDKFKILRVDFVSTMLNLTGNLVLHVLSSS